MDKDLNDSDCQNSSISRDYENEQSLVGKFKKNVSEIINNTPLSKWFKKQSETPVSTPRKRQDDSDDEADIHEFQPPSKRTKLPPTKETISLNVSEVLSPISKVNDVKNPLYTNFPEPIAGPSGYQTRKLLNSTSFTKEAAFKNAKSASESTNLFKNPKSIVRDRIGASSANKDINSDSEESTSGYSSGRLGSKEVVSHESSKQTSPLESSPIKARSLFRNSSSGRSLFSERTLSPHRNSSLSSRMPSFNPSNFGSQNFVDRTLSTKKILESPFYSGRTIYGGASAYGKSSGRTPQDLKKALRQSVKIKPVNRDVEKSGDVQLGKTARRILDTLEQYSSPVSDAKKIPVVSKKIRSEGVLTKYIGANPYMVRGSRSASNRELQVPSVTDLLKMKLDQQKTRLQDSTEAVRQIATQSKSALNETSYQLAVHKDTEKHTGKIKRKITSVRQKIQIDETVPELKLNPVALPIKELPKFDFVVPPPSTSKVVDDTQPKLTGLFGKTVTTPLKVNDMTEKDKITVDDQKSGSVKEDKFEFKFSAPIVLAECSKSIKALNNFKFSEPLVKKRRSIHSDSNNQENGSAELFKVKKNNGENVLGVTSVTDTGKKEKCGTNNGSWSLGDKFKPKVGTWECSMCMIRNEDDKLKCAACETSRSATEKPKNIITDSPSFFPLSTAQPTINFSFGSKSSVAPPPSNSFGDKFKPASNTWECPSCMIRNQDNVTICVACKDTKPGNNVAQPKSITSSVADNGATGPSFGSKLAPPPSTWECSTCMIRNKEELSVCAACNSLKSGTKSVLAVQQLGETTFGAEFKKKDNEWECEICMVKNPLSATKCQCCENPRSGTSSLAASTTTSGGASKIPSFSFGIDKNTASSFTFGIPPGLQEAPKTNASLVFGESKVDGKQTTEQTTPTFTFGVPPKDATKPTQSATVLPTSSVTIATAGDSHKNDASKPPPAYASGSTAAVLGTTAPKKAEDGIRKKEELEVKPTNPLLKPGERLPEKAATAPAGFSFGLPKAPALSTSVPSIPKPSSDVTTFDDSPSKKTKRANEDQAVVPTFSFGSAAATSSSNGDLMKAAPSFSKPAEQKPPTTSTPSGGFAFSFGSAKPAAGSAEASRPAPTFGSSATNGSKKEDLFKIATSSSEPPKSTNGLNFSAPTQPFGAKTSTETKPFSFGTPSTLPAATAPQASQQSSAPPSFGSTAPLPKTTPSFKFGSASDDKTQKSFAFATPSFGSGAAQSASFGGFGAKPTAAADSSTASASTLFGSANQNQVSAFGSAAATAPQSSAPNGLFNFGASGQGASQKAVFSFGAADQNGPKEGQTGFSFGSNTSTAPAAPASFNFSGPAPSFDATAKPVFNFTGSSNVPTFSAPPVQEGMPKRIIKKAIRRVR